MRALVSGLAAVGTFLAVTAGSSPTLSFDHKQFCVAVREVIRSSAGDVGTWADRFTRKDGVEIVCDRKLVHFKRYFGAPANTLSAEWKERKAQAWESAYCKRPLWREAVDNGWIVSATVTTITGERLWLACLPGGKGFHRMIPAK
jgi:hypothetical protein